MGSTALTHPRTRASTNTEGKTIANPYRIKLNNSPHPLSKAMGESAPDALRETSPAHTSDVERNRYDASR